MKTSLFVVELENVLGLKVQNENVENDRSKRKVRRSRSSRFYTKFYFIFCVFPLQATGE